MKKFLLFLSLFIWGANVIYSQISEGGRPPSFDFTSSKIKSLQNRSKVSVDVPILFDKSELLLEDIKNGSLSTPLRVGVIIPIELSMDNSGEWFDLPNGQRIWQLEINAPGALAISLLYDQFIIPEGDKLFIYSKDRRHIIGAFTNKANRLKKEFATEFVAGDQIILEYVIDHLKSNSDGNVVKEGLPSENKDKIDSAERSIVISGVQYGYNYIEVQYNSELGRSGYCQVDINCSEGAAWQDQKKGVYKTLTPINGSSYLCTGTIVNNTSENFEPLALTAHHCFMAQGKEATVKDLRQQVYYFNYERDGCDTEEKDVKGVQTMVGAVMLAKNKRSGSSDGALLRLNTYIPVDYGVYYNGWYSGSSAATSGVGIHHPLGDVKKINTFKQKLVSQAGTQWKAVWSETDNGWGQTEPGSSGSPLFNQDGLVIGTLTGAPNIGSTPRCDAPIAMRYSLYGKLWNHVNKPYSKDPALQIKTYLDPANLGVQSMHGSYNMNYIEVDKDHFVLKDKGSSSNRISVNSSVPWEATASSWIDIIEIEDDCLVFELLDNNFDYRVGHITLTSGGIVKSITVEQSAAAPFNLQATYDEKESVILSWNDDYLSTVELTDDVEDHEPFRINSSGKKGWLFKDCDMSRTSSVEGVSFPNMYKPMSFIVFNQEMIEGADEAGLTAHSGNQFLACFSADVGRNNDWIISPRLNFGGEYFFSFFARSLSVEKLAERFNVYYSFNSASDFIKIDPFENGIKASEEGYIEAPEEWTHYVFKLPAEAQYVAVNCISSAADVFMIDDLYIGENDKGIEQYFDLQKRSLLQKNKTRSSINEVTQANASLKWHNNGSEYSSFGGTGIPFEFAVSFDKYDLQSYIGLSLDTVLFRLSAEAECNLKIYINDEVVRQQPLGNLIINSFNTVVLDESLLIDESIETLMISIDVLSYEEGTYPAPYERGFNQPEGKGDLYYQNNSWRNLLANRGNWFITAKLNGFVKPVELIYTIYKNGEKVATTEETSYFDTDSKGGNRCFSVTATQKGVNLIESSFSNEVCQFVKHLLTIKANNVEKFQGEVNPIVTDEYTVKGFVDNDNVTYLSKKPVASVDPIFKPHIGVGVYTDAIIVSGAEDVTNKYRFTYLYGNLIVKDHPVGIENIDGVEVKIYPTVTTGVINVNQLSEKTDVYLFDYLGRMIITRKLQTGDNMIDISSLTKGVYFVRIGSHVTKVIKI